MKEKILRTYMGVIRGSLGGREDGYPERKYSSHTTLEGAVSLGSRDSHVEYFELVPIPKKDIAAARKASEVAAQRDAIEDVNREIRDLQSRRKRLKKGESP